MTAIAAPEFLWLEITSRCQLECAMCYSDSGPAGTHGSMTSEDWMRVIDEAVHMGVRTVQFIGGEPTLHSALPELIRHALSRALAVEVFSNLGAPRGAPSYPWLSQEELKGGSWA
ncbi:MAG: radical SAM protein [Pseudonocardiaceae bacterium]